MRSGVTYQDVALAAEELQQAGERPTIERVRAHLGSTGSNTTISKYLQVWREQANSLSESTEKKATPNIVQAAVDSVWQQMRGQADAEIAAIEEAARQNITAAQTAAEDAEKALAQANQQRQVLENTYHALSAEHELLKLDIKEQRHQNAIKQEQYQTLESRFNDMQTCLTQQIKDITNLHHVEISRLDKLHEQALQARDQSISSIKTQYESARGDMLLQLDSAKVEKEKLSAQIKKLEITITELQLLSETSQTKQFAAEKAQAEMKAQLQHQTEQFATLKQFILMPEELLSKVVNAITVDQWFAKIEHHSSELFEKKLKKMDELIEALQTIPTKETVNA